MRKPLGIILRPRRCKYCKAVFTPKRVQDHKARFCEPNHRKDYYRYGGLPFDKLMARLHREMQTEIATFMQPTIHAVSDLIERVTALETRRRKK